MRRSSCCLQGFWRRLLARAAEVLAGSDCCAAPSFLWLLMDEDHKSLRQILTKRCLGAKFRDDDIKKLLDAGYDTETAIASASKEALGLVLPTRPGVMDVLVKAFLQPGGPGKDHFTTRQQWLKQELPELKLAFSAPPGLRSEEIEYHPESVKMWELPLLQVTKVHYTVLVIFPISQCIPVPMRTL